MKTKIRTVNILDGLAVVAVLSAMAFAWLTARPAQALPADSAAAAVRVEIQRYMGYEILPARYLSLPYDLTMNTNEQVAILDIGFLLLAFVPIVMLLGLRSKPQLQWAVMLSCLLLLVVSTGNGFVYNPELGMVKSEGAALEAYLTATSFADAPVGVMMAQCYKWLLPLYAGIEYLLSKVSGDQDAVTYPMLLAFLVFFFYLARKRFEGQQPERQGLMAFLLVYTFFWLILSSGIVWYGFLVLPLFTALVFLFFSNKNTGPGLYGKIALYVFYAAVALTVFIGYAQRISNININIVKQDPMAGKRLLDPAYLKYLAGDLDSDGVIEAFYRGLTPALNEMNRETSSLIYNVGTRFAFFILENDKRVFKDNQLDFFHQVQSKYPFKERITTMLKNAGFRYIMVDFNTPSGDKTPEQTLVERYKNFMLLLYNNPGLELIATNRVLKETLDGKEQYKYGVFGEVKEFGSYAVYRIK